MNITKMIDSIADQAHIPETDEDFIADDGLLYCGKCFTPKQYRVQLPMMGVDKVVPILCSCEKERRDKEDAERKRREEIEHIRRMKGTCIHDKGLLECTFDHDDGSVPQIISAKRYVDTWPKRKAQNDGLLLWGGVGTGKTFFAACIANALIEQGVSVLMTNFAKILNKLSGLYSDEKNDFIADMMRYSLLIIDDFGIERSTEFALEQVYNIIDERYKAKMPLIITTNLSITTLENPVDTAHQRIYDRVLAMCIPVSFQGNNHRKQERKKKFENGEELFREEGEDNE